MFGAPPEPVLDDALRLYATKRGVPVMALDRGSEIAALFTVGLSESEQAIFLKNVLLAPTPLDQRYDAMGKSYLADDLEALIISGRLDEKVVTEAVHRFAKQFDHGLLTERNLR
ncbi:MAG: hypothetical protein EXQ99_04485 [Alphaproteobacteria bacterium]|nr:hypothetical protein [Alphaproteobacteria bacterium]